jgi:hypothetical protein
MKARASSKEAVETIFQIGVRLGPDEKQRFTQRLTQAEREANLAPGTLTAAAYARSIILNFLASKS